MLLPESAILPDNGTSPRAARILYAYGYDSERQAYSEMRKRLLLAIAAVMAAAGLSACGGGGSSPSGVGDYPDLEISVYQGADALGGDTVLLSDVVAQGKPVVLNFWAALCPPCRTEMPDFQRVYEERSEQITMLGVDIGPQQSLGTREEGRELLTELGVSYPAGSTFSASVVRDYEVLSMPTTLFITPSGEIVRTWSGFLTEERLSELIDELIAV